MAWLYGTAAGIIFGTLIAASLYHNIIFLTAGAGAAFLLAGVGAAYKQAADRRAASCELQDYPSYKY